MLKNIVAGVYNDNITRRKYAEASVTNYCTGSFISKCL